jgi:hypothetical protein
VKYYCIFFYSLDLLVLGFYPAASKKFAEIKRKEQRNTSSFFLSKKATIFNALHASTLIFRRPHPNPLLKGEGACYLYIVRLYFSL